MFKFLTDLNKESKTSLGFFVMMIAYILVAFIGQAVILILKNSDGVASIVISSCFSAVAICLTVFIFGRKDKILKNSFTEFNPLYLIISVSVFSGMFLGLGFLNGIIASLTEKLGGNVSGIELNIDGFPLFILYTLCFAILPAVFEELFFRGYLLNGYKDVKPTFSVIISALLFALYHTSLAQFFYQFIYGLFLGVLAVKSKSIIPSCIAHFLNNFIIILLTYIKFELNFLNPVVIIIGAVLLAFSVVGFFLIGEKPERTEYNGRVKDVLVPYGIFGIAFCLLIIIVGVFL